MDADEETLLRQCRRGERPALERLIRRFDARVLNLAYRLTADAEAARDIRQQTFLRAVRSIRRFRGECGLQTWLYRIALNLCRDRERSTASQERLHGALREQARIQTSPCPEEQLARHELAVAVARAVRELPAAEREVLVLHHYQGLPFASVAELLATPVTTIKSRWQRCLPRLRSHLQRVGETA